MALRAVIFDLDGTLVDSLQDIRRAANVALASVGLAGLNTEEVRNLVGRGLRALMEGALHSRGGDLNLAESLTSMAVAEYARTPVRETRPYPGIKELVEAIPAWGWTLGVLTNKRQALAELVVNELFGEGRFAVVVGEVPGQPVKPAAAAMERVLTSLGVRAAEVLLVGDSLVDVLTGLAAGVRTVGVTWGYGSRKELEGAWQIVDETHQLLSHLKRLGTSPEV